MDTIGRGDTSRIGRIDHRSDLIWFIPRRKGTTAWRIHHPWDEEEEKEMEGGKEESEWVPITLICLIFTPLSEREHLTRRVLRNTQDQLKCWMIFHILDDVEARKTFYENLHTFTVWDPEKVRSWKCGMPGTDVTIYAILRFCGRRIIMIRFKYVVLENFDCDFKDQH